MSPHRVTNSPTTFRISLLLLLVAFVATLPSPASAAGNGAWAVEPSGPPDAPVTSRGAFFYELAPGQTIDDWVSIQNQSDETMSFYLFGADAYNTAEGAWALTERGDPKEFVGTWLDVGDEAITVPPATELRVNFSITIPADASPGDYAGGIVALNQVIEGVIEGEANAQTTIGLQRAVGTRMFVRVAGPVRPALVVTDMESRAEDRLSRDGGDVVTTYTVKNIGNMRLNPTIVLSADGLLKDSYFVTEPTEIAILLPGESATFEHRWEDLPLVDVATVTVVANHDKVVATASSDVILVAPAVWLSILGLGVLIALIVVRRRRKRTESDMPPERELVGAANG